MEEKLSQDIFMTTEKDGTIVYKKRVKNEYSKFLSFLVFGANPLIWTIWKLSRKKYRYIVLYRMKTNNKAPELESEWKKKEDVINNDKSIKNKVKDKKEQPENLKPDGGFI